MRMCDWSVLLLVAAAGGLLSTGITGCATATGLNQPVETTITITDATGGAQNPSLANSTEETVEIVEAKADQQFVQIVIEGKWPPGTKLEDQVETIYDWKNSRMAANSATALDTVVAAEERTEVLLSRHATIERATLASIDVVSKALHEAFPLLFAQRLSGLDEEESSGDVLDQLLNWATEWGLIDGDPARTSSEPLEPPRNDAHP